MIFQMLFEKSLSNICLAAKGVGAASLITIGVFQMRFFGLCGQGHLGGTCRQTSGAETNRTGALSAGVIVACGKDSLKFN